MTGNELMTENEKYPIKQQFIKTFGGTTFKHLVEWFKSQKQGEKIRIFDFNEYSDFTRWKGYDYGVMRDAGYYLCINDFRANLLIYVKNNVKDKGIKHDKIIDSIKGHNSAISAFFRLKELEIEKKQYDDYLPFKGINTDMFTPVYEYQSNYNIGNQSDFEYYTYKESIIRNGILFKNDIERIEFLKKIYEQLKIYLKFGQNDYKKMNSPICLITRRELQWEF